MVDRGIGRLQPITKENCTLSVPDQIEAFCKGGARWVQLRLKEASGSEFLEIAQKARRITKDHKVALIIDDRVDMVKEVQADGVHLGELDLPPWEARQLLGKNAIIGGTADRFERIERIAVSVDYIGCGPFRFTNTKERLSPILGLEGYRAILTRMEEEGIRVPLLAIGGIGAEDIPSLIQAGMFGVALSSTIVEAKDPVNTTAELIELLTNAAN